jgi:ribosomal protein S18 acetylase RimI-like enzyme
VRQRAWRFEGSIDMLDLGGYGWAVLLAGLGSACLLVARRRLRHSAGWLTLPDSRQPPRCAIRLLKAEDFEACEAIYRLNEARHFPAGMFESFAQVLREGQVLFLVAESDREVRAFAGLSMGREEGAERANLSFGMVHPAFQKCGYGTALLQARLAMLPLARRAWLVALTTTGGSETFFARFGFVFANPVPIETGERLDAYQVHVSRHAQRRCAAAVAGLLVPAPFGSTYVPAITYRVPMASQRA